MSTKARENVTWPIACAIVPSSMNVRRWTKTSSSAVPITISGVTSVASDIARAVPAVRPRQRVSPTASATPIGTASSTAIAASRRLCRSAELRSGSWRTDRSGSPVYQRSDQPCAVERERPSLNENRIATRIGTIDHAR